MKINKSAEPRKPKLLHISISAINTISDYARKEGLDFKRFSEYILEVAANRIKKMNQKNVPKCGK